MLRTARAVCDIYPFLDADLLAAGVILHDLCKLDELAADEIGMVSDYTREGQLLGHLVMGVAALDRCARELGAVSYTHLSLSRSLEIKTHAGHRERLRRRALMDGAEALRPHELLELLLFYAIPRRDVNALAHELDKRFGGVCGVLAADEAALAKRCV